MPGSLDLFDGVALTALTESSARNAAVDTLQVHHATMTSFSGLKSLMDPGGRTVSANGAMSNDGHLDEVVQLSRRAFTSATSFDNRCLTVECCNLTLSPDWRISEASKERFARLAVDMFRAGILRGFHYGAGGIIGHADVPGTYATACPGPDMHVLDIIERAKALHDGATAPQPKEDSMLIYKSTSSSTTDALIPGGLSFIQGPDGVFRPLASHEWDSYVYWADPKRGDARVPVRVNEWAGEDIRDIAKYTGVREFDGIEKSRDHFIPRLTGRVIFAAKEG